MSAMQRMNLGAIRDVRASSSTDDWTMEQLDNLFQREVYGDRVMTTTTLAEFLRSWMYSLHLRGAFKGYGFLFEMPEDDGIHWLRMACINLKKLHERMPEDFPPDGVEASFDRLRKWRKSKRPNP